MPTPLSSHIRLVCSQLAAAARPLKCGTHGQQVSGARPEGGRGWEAKLQPEAGYAASQGRGALRQPVAGGGCHNLADQLPAGPGLSAGSGLLEHLTNHARHLHAMQYERTLCGGGAGGGCQVGQGPGRGAQAGGQAGWGSALRAQCAGLGARCASPLPNLSALLTPAGGVLLAACWWPRAAWARWWLCRRLPSPITVGWEA